MIVIFLIVCCIFVEFSQADCKTMYNDCNGHGTCSNDGFVCICSAGYKGLSCKIAPPIMKEGVAIPGQVDNADRKVSYYQILSGQVTANKLVTLRPSSGNLDLYASIGTPPKQNSMTNEWEFQFVGAASMNGKSGEKEFTIDSTDPANPDIMDKTLFIAVVNSPMNSNATQFTLYYWSATDKNGLIPGIPTWAAYVIFGVAGCCVLCCCIIVIVVFVLKQKRSGGGSSKKAARSDTNNDMQMNAMGLAQPVMQPGYNMGGQPQQQQQQFMMNNNAGMMTGSELARPSGMYDNTEVRNPYGGGSPQGTYPSAMQQPNNGMMMTESVGGSYNLGGGGMPMGAAPGGVGVGMYDENQLMMQPSQTFNTGPQFAGQPYGGAPDYGGNGGQNDVVPLW